MKKNLLAIAAFALLLTSCETKLVEKVDLIPLAENVEIHKGAFPLSNLQSIQVPDEWKLTADNFVKDLQKTASLTVSLTDSEGSLVIVKDESLSAEAYRLNIEKNRSRRYTRCQSWFGQFTPTDYDCKRCSITGAHHTGQACIRLQRIDAGLCPSLLDGR